VTSAHFRYLISGIREFGNAGDPSGMDLQRTMSTTLWLNLAMLFMNTAIWLDNAIRLAGG
jgi:hypothetical protein